MREVTYRPDDELTPEQQAALKSRVYKAMDLFADMVKESNIDDTVYDWIAVLVSIVFHPANPSGEAEEEIVEEVEELLKRRFRQLTGLDRIN